MLRRKEVEFWFEFASTYSYPAAMLLEDTASTAGVRVTYKPFLLGPIFARQGWSDSPFNLYPTKGAYMWRDMERICSAQSIPFSRPSAFPRNGLLAARIACAFAEEPWLPAYVRAIYRANFAQDQDISQRDVVAGVLQDLGLISEDIFERALAVENKEALRAQTERAEQIGIFGAPTFVVGQELFWGSDRMLQALEFAAA